MGERAEEAEREETDEEKSWLGHEWWRVVRLDAGVKATGDRRLIELCQATSEQSATLIRNISVKSVRFALRHLAPSEP
jgi:hypothetical protein